MEELKKNNPEKYAEMQLGAQAYAYNERFNKLKHKVTSKDVKSTPADLLEYQSMMAAHSAAREKFNQKKAAEQLAKEPTMQAQTSDTKKTKDNE
jgi:hypothetical protein